MVARHATLAGDRTKNRGGDLELTFRVGVVLRPLQTRLSDNGSIHERSDLLHVVHEKTIEEIGVRVPQMREVEILLDRRSLGMDLLEAC